jgi:hypothetical protein
MVGVPTFWSGLQNGTAVFEVQLSPQSFQETIRSQEGYNSHILWPPRCEIDFQSAGRYVDPLSSRSALHIIGPNQVLEIFVRPPIRRSSIEVRARSLKPSSIGTPNSNNTSMPLEAELEHA